MFVRKQRSRPKPGSRRSSSSRAGSRGKGAGKAHVKGQGKADRPLISRPETLQQRHLDLIGLALLGLSLYLALVLYLGWEGGLAGGAMRDALTFSFGQVAYLAPFVGAAIASVLIFKPYLSALAPLRSGGICVIAGVLLALAAQTAGLGGSEPRPNEFDSGWMAEHGGLVGESMYWLATTLFQRVGAHIIAVTLIAAGILLLTGGTIATFLAATHRVAGRARQGGGEVARTLTRGRTGGAAGAAGAAGPAQATHDIFAEAETALVPNVMDDYPPEDELDPTVVVAPPVDSQSPFEDDEADTGELPTPAVDPDESDVPVVTGEQMALTPLGNERGGVTVSDEIAYSHPAVSVLERGRADAGPDSADHDATAKKLVETLGHFGVEARVIAVVSGPHVSRYELRLAPGIKVKKVSELANDLAYALASTDIRILAPIPGKQAVGVEVPNSRRRMVRLGDIYEDRPANSSPLVAWLGKGIDGKAVWTDLAKMPHILVAGTTGSGKSGCVNAILSSILMHADPNEVRFVLVDPKQVELNHYENIPHLLTPVVTSPRLASNVLTNLISEMESRYGIMGQARCRNLGELNRARRKAGQPPLPYILCVIDELADLMMVSPAEVEDAIIRLAQKSRATGIHLVLATQRPSTDIITGTIKVNIPARIAFAVSSQTDSRVILDQGGAESLLGQGDMLFRGAGSSKMERIQGAFVTEEEIAKVTDHWGDQGRPVFADELLEVPSEAAEGESEEEFDPDQDDLMEHAIRLVIETDTASVSMVQRRLRVGYTRAGRLIDMLERRGVISGYEGSKPRQVLVTEADLPRILGWGQKSAPPEGDAGASETGAGLAHAGEAATDRAIASDESGGDAEGGAEPDAERELDATPDANATDAGTAERQAAAESHSADQGARLEV
ncbi:MAG TPA: DNA translocase FtsK [Solirubrobacterales bacterium]|nr:DNA translocase FtsK [Solirubrobacterales bacterium]